MSLTQPWVLFWPFSLSLFFWGPNAQKQQPSRRGLLWSWIVQSHSILLLCGRRTNKNIINQLLKQPFFLVVCLEKKKYRNSLNNTDYYFGSYKTVLFAEIETMLLICKFKLAFALLADDGCSRTCCRQAYNIVNILLPSLGAYERGLKDAVAENLKKKIVTFSNASLKLFVR